MRAHEESARPLRRGAAARSRRWSSLRNEVDELERASEPARALFGAGALRRDCARWMWMAMRRRLRFARGRMDAARECSQATMARLLQTAPRAARGGGRGRSCAAMRTARRRRRRERRRSASKLGRISSRAGGSPGLGGRAQAYWQALDRLRAARPLEDLARELTRIAEESAQNSLGSVAALAAPVAQPLGSGTAQAAQRIRVAAADDCERRPLRRRRRDEGVPPLLQPVPAR